MADIEKPVDLAKLRNTFTPCPNCKARIEAAADELEELRPKVDRLSATVTWLEGSDKALPVDG